MNAPFRLPVPLALRGTAPTIRDAIGTAIEALVALLDAMEADADLEDGDNEDADETEDGFIGRVDEHAGEPDDAEPSLGSIENNWPAFYYGRHGPEHCGPGDQSTWAAGSADDLEDGGEGEEPSLGWTATIRQAGVHWAGACDDAEQEHDGREPLSQRDDREQENDSGIGDDDGAAEQFGIRPQWAQRVE